MLLLFCEIRLKMVVDAVWDASKVQLSRVGGVLLSGESCRRSGRARSLHDLE